MIVDINTEVCPWISDIHENDINETVTNYAKLGYLVSTMTKIQVDPSNSIMDPIKNLFLENKTYLTHVEQNIASSIGSLTQTVNKSSLKGKLGEHAIEEIIKTAFPDDTIENMAQQSNESDFHFHATNEKQTFLIEVKTYTANVNTAQIDKFHRDMDRTNLPVGIFVSTTSGIIGHPRLNIQYSPKNQLLIYIPNSGFEYAPIIYAILFAKQSLKQTNCKPIDHNKIIELYSQFETSFNDISKFRYEIYKTKQTITQSLDNLYKQAMDTEVRVKYLLDDTKHKIQKELANSAIVQSELPHDFYEQMRKTNDKRLPQYKFIEEIAKNKNLKITTDEEDPMKWNFYKTELLVGQTKYTKTRVDFVLVKPPITVPVNDDTAEFLEKILT